MPRPRLFHLVLATLALALTSACDRDTETALRSRLNQWFFVSDTAYFASRPRCTGAMFHVSVDRPRPGLALESDPDRAKNALTARGVAALRIGGLSPAELTDLLLLFGQGSFGKQALPAGALAGHCFEDRKISGYLHEALNRPGAILAYDGATEGLMILDTDRNRLFYVAGDVW